MSSLANLLDSGIASFCNLWPEGIFVSYDFNVRGLLAIIMVALVCGSIGSLVVGNRMAFFSDALAHCAFAGVGLALLLALFTNLVGNRVQEVQHWILLVMILFGVAVGLGIAWVQERTSLASDTVIGVFFAGAMGFGAMVMQRIARQGFFTLEDFLFGNPTNTSAVDLVLLFLLLLATTGFLIIIYNPLVFTTFNVSLARSRRIRVRLCNYLFIIFLGVIVNLCLHIVGALLINALLIVPAATASILSKNMRQMFWWSIGLCLFAGILGQVLSWEIPIPDGPGRPPIHFGEAGTIVVLSVLLFFISMVLGSRWRERTTVAAPG